MSPPVMSNNQTVAELLRLATTRLANSSDSSRLDAEVLLRHAMGLDRTALFARLRDHVDLETGDRFFKLIDARATGTPVSYITGEREFMGLSFVIRPSVLIPRPETEQLVEWSLNWLKSRPEAAIVDVGTGSGAIVLSVAKLTDPKWIGDAIGIDFSQDALGVAMINRARFGLDDRVELLQGDLLDPISDPVDLILANLPYLTPSQIEENAELLAEPREALDGGPDGLALIRRVLDDAPRVLKPNGALVLELDPSHAEEAARLARSQFPDSLVCINRDLSGRNRLVSVERNNMNQEQAE